MTYEQVAGITQVAALLFFIALFVGVVIYAFWPGNKKRFEETPRSRLRRIPIRRRKTAMARREPHSSTEPETTGHEWDGITELNKPLPKWWLWTFYATIVWAIGYWLLMPSSPLVAPTPKVSRLSRA